MRGGCVMIHYIYTCPGRYARAKKYFGGELNLLLDLSDIYQALWCFESRFDHTELCYATMLEF